MKGCFYGDLCKSIVKLQSCEEIGASKANEGDNLGFSSLFALPDTTL